MGLPPSEISEVPRHEWMVWRRLIGDQDLPRVPAFADYCIANPQPSEVDPRIMRPSASIRYTAAERWLILKGRNLRDHGYAQFHQVCRDLTALPEYCGAAFSWGDCYITQCAANQAGTGNLTTWRKVGTSHHLAFVLGQLSSLDGL